MILNLEEVIALPAFENAKATFKIGEKLSNEELIRAVRYFIAAEYEAVQMYTQVAEITDNKLAKAVLLDIAEEELVHAGEFLRLLKEISPTDWERYEEGFKEVEEIVEKLEDK